MLTSLLIANRGEIARRIIRTARRLGVRTVAVYSEADAQAPHVREADAAVLIGPSAARDSYLVGDKIIAAAIETEAEAIHPGYGFLSENADFAQAVIDAGIVWVGPPPAAIRAMGLKDAAKRLMSQAGVPVTPGYLGDDQSPDVLAREAATIGWPVLIKAVAGGGGKGMRKVEAAAEFAAALAAAKREAAAAFGDDRVLLEKYVTRPRHIEVQVFGDRHGAVVHLYERDCSLQRRHQKVIEEAPAPGMDAATRAVLCDAAVRAARAVAYEGAGTIEFIADASDGLRPDRVWFMEMNTRLQVEHPVTEMVTGQDLVEWQLRVASGEPLPLTQDQITLEGWAMEARLYAENTQKGFLPSTGPLDVLRLPWQFRIDAGVEEGGVVTHHYDPMIAKLIRYGSSRREAATELAQACREVGVWPVRTNAGFLVRCLTDPDFLAGDIDTGFIGDRLDKLAVAPEPSPEAVEHAAAVLIPYHPGPIGFRLNASPSVQVRLASGERRYEVELPPDILKKPRAYPTPAFGKDGEIIIFEGGEAFVFSDVEHQVAEASAAGDQVVSPMPGRIVAVHVAEGAAVAQGQPILVLEAMKMEHVLTAPRAGKVEGLTVQPGAQVEEGVTLARIASAAGD